MNSSTKFFAGVITLVLFGQGCVPTSVPPEPTQAPERMEQDASQKDDAMMEGEAMEGDDGMKKDDAMMEGEAMEPVSSHYAPFTKEVYDAARAEGKPILLFFYASWCPYCKEQDPRFAKVIPEHEGGVVALRVNYNDTDTDADEKALAQEFGVTYQHTMFFIGKDGETKKKAIGTLTDDQTREYLDLISS